MPAERVVVAGSGVTGLACAAGFAKLGRSVVLCGDEPEAFDSADDYDLRVFALNEASCDLLKRLGAWDAVASRRLCGYEAMEVWCGRGRLRFHATDVARARLGVVVENRLLRSTLFEQLRARGDVEIRCPARLQSLQPAGVDGSRVTLDDGAVFEASLVVGADGASSLVRRWAAIGCKRRSYNQDAIVATVECDAAHGNVCLQRFSHEGVTAFLPLGDGEGKTGSIVWSCAKPLADELSALSGETFGVRLTAALERRLGGMRPVSERVAFPLYGALAEDYVSEGVALVGDAAHNVHPLAGQGANLGLADVRTLLDVVASSGYGVRLSVLRRYQRNVKGRNLAMKCALDAIRRWFSGEPLPLDAPQAAGLAFVDRCPPLKAWFIRRAVEGRGGWV